MLLKSHKIALLVGLLAGCARAPHCGTASTNPGPPMWIDAAVASVITKGHATQELATVADNGFFREMQIVLVASHRPSDTDAFTKQLASAIVAEVERTGRVVRSLDWNMVSGNATGFRMTFGKAGGAADGIVDLGTLDPNSAKTDKRRFMRYTIRSSWPTCNCHGCTVASL